MADPNHKYNKLVKLNKPCHNGRLFEEEIFEGSRCNIIAVFAFCAAKHDINSRFSNMSKFIEKYDCKNCRREATAFGKYISINKAKTNLSLEFIKKFIYFKIDKRDYYFGITQKDKDYLNRPEITFEYLKRPCVKSDIKPLEDEVPF